MTDKDVIEKFHSIMKRGSVIEVIRTDTRLDLWRWRTERFEDVQMVIVVMWPYLLSRRRTRIKEVMMTYHTNGKRKVYRRQAIKVPA